MTPVHAKQQFSIQITLDNYHLHDRGLMSEQKHPTHVASEM